MEKYNELVAFVEAMKVDVEKATHAEKPNKAAITRTRVKLQELKRLAQEFRLELLDKSKDKE